MSFQEFDLSEYFDALEDFKKNSSDAILKYWGGLKNFNLFIQKVKEDEPEVARLAIKQFGSIDAYTKAMRHNLEHFTEIMDEKITEDVKEIGQQSDALYAQLTADMSREVSSPEIQQIVQEIIDFIGEHAAPDFAGRSYCDIIAEAYSNDFIQKMTDEKYGAGAAAYIVQAVEAYAGCS